VDTEVFTLACTYRLLHQRQRSALRRKVEVAEERENLMLIWWLRV